MKYTRLFTDKDGKSQLESLEFPLFDAYVGKTTQPIAASKIVFGEVNASIEQSWHNPPCRQFIIMLEGDMEIEISRGAKQIFNVGDVLLAEDLTGEGHMTRSRSKGICKYIAIPLS